jgi:hypothetical protein
MGSWVVTVHVFWECHSAALVGFPTEATAALIDVFCALGHYAYHALKAKPSTSKLKDSPNPYPL